MASAINQVKIKKELLNRLRSADILSIAERGVTTTTDLFNGDNSTLNFILTNNGVKNIRTITVDSVPQNYSVDWDYSESVSGGNVIMTITFTTAPTTGTNNISIEYDYSTTGDRIYPDFPKETITNTKFPRVGFDIISSTTQELAIGGQFNQTNLLISIGAYGIGTTQTESIIDSIRQFFIDNKKSFNTLNFITFDSVGPLLVAPNTNNKINSRTIDFVSPFEFEL